MGAGVKATFLVLFLVFAYFVGLMIFTKGFLLIRTMVHQNNSCEVEFATRSHDLAHGGHNGCWTHARFKRAIVIIIDALRYDFLSYNSSLKSDALPYKNRLKTVHALLSRQPQNSRLYKFIADPPTTTLQRLKGLTTGSLPTFVDAGANFDSSEITEDNWVDQLITQGKDIKFLGDDTWESLFPNRFYKSFPFPSFNVKDLHTVDNGILKHLYPEMRRRDWDVLIAHFLGVDHCGHRYGPNHPAMASKLDQMDGIIRNITSLMKDDTVLFVLGDHGMTRSGDHGGDSEDELTAGLFIYSPAQLTASSPTSYDRTQVVQQTDLVPTLSLLLGLPIPFSNLGMVIPDLFNHCPWWDTQHNNIRQVYHTVKALHLNAMQVSKYLTSYERLSSDFPQDKFHTLQGLLQRSEAQLEALVTNVATGSGCSQGPVPWLVIIMIGLLSSCFFYATGHQATIPAIRFEAAFTGFHGDFSNNIVPALLITLNTFAAPILFAIVSPLMLFWPHLRGPVSQWMVSAERKGKESEDWKGDFSLFDNGVLLRKNLMCSCCRLLLFHAVKTLGAACAAGLHRRHLMVWKIFAPRFVFEAANLLIVSVVLFFMMLLVLRVDRAVTKLTKTLQKT